MPPVIIPRSRRRRLAGRVFWALAGVLTLFSAIIFNQSYRFTHFDSEVAKASSTKPTGLTLARYALLGLPNSRPVDGPAPDTAYQEVRLTATDGIHLAAWYVPVANSRGTVALFHGYHGERSGLHTEAKQFRRLGYNTLQLDFRGSGASDGNYSSVGYEEGKDVKAAYDWLKQQNTTAPIYLFGTSMGAVSILRGMSQFPQMQPAGLILECPFATILEASRGRMRSLHIPEEPIASMIVFSSSLQNGFWGFSHDAVAYARTVRTPTLLQWGEQDQRVSRAETQAVLAALQGPKQLVTYPTAGHESYARHAATRWQQAVDAFLP